MIKNFLFFTSFSPFFVCLSVDGLQTFDFSKFDTNRIELKLNTGFGSGVVRGKISNIAGKINFSIDKIGDSQGKLIMDARSVRFGYNKVDSDAHNTEWLNSAHFPKILYTLKSMEQFRWENDFLYAQTNGVLSIKSTSLPISFPVQIHYRKGERKRYDGKNGDMIFIRGNFQLSREKLSINSDSAFDSILDTVHVSIHLMAASNKVRLFLPSKAFGKN
tara:strand:+ start:1031 stop:1684 length:654 start_codon:yes stop_codon:yes gene_type:complete